MHTPSSNHVPSFNLVQKRAHDEAIQLANAVFLPVPADSLEIGPIPKENVGFSRSGELVEYCSNMWNIAGKNGEISHFLPMYGIFFIFLQQCLTTLAGPVKTYYLYENLFGMGKFCYEIMSAN